MPWRGIWRDETVPHGKLSGYVHMAISSLEQHAHWNLNQDDIPEDTTILPRTVLYWADTTSNGTNPIARMEVLKLFLVFGNTVMGSTVLLAACRRRGRIGTGLKPLNW